MKRTLALIAVFALSACAHVVSSEVRKGAVEAPFSEVKSNIEKYKGSTFIWGGFIANTAVTEDGTEVLVVQNPLGEYGDILDTDVSEGRFVVVHPGELDPLIYDQDRLITVAGTLVGERKVVRKGREHVYPVLQAKEIYLWKEELIYFAPDYYPGWGHPYRSKPIYRRPVYMLTPVYIDRY
jgi:outer membrane lipoprotein